MKQHLFSTSILLCGTFLLLLLLSGCANPCKKSNCLNGGACLDGECICTGNCKGRQCEICPQTVEFTPDPALLLCPNLQVGDTEFGESSVLLEASAEIYQLNQSLRAKIYFHLREEGGDFSEAHNTWDFEIYAAPAGYEVLEIQSDDYSSCTGMDSDNFPAAFPQGSDELVQQFEMNAKSEGPDIGNCTPAGTFLNVLFRAVSVTVIQKS